jgi:Lrp/AsnC family transcriptional regulator, regulator for asnA, asnC and gidA
MAKELLDSVDYEILNILSQDSKVSYAEIGLKVHLSQGAVHTRVKKMETAGIITGSVIKIDLKKLGWDIVAFLGIYLEKSEMYDDVARQLERIPEILNINYTTGNYSIFVKICCRDTEHLRNVLHDKIQKVQGIQRTETFISLEESLNKITPLA